MAEQELRNCPFCGGNVIRTIERTNVIYCAKCLANASNRLWNTRPIKDALQLRAERAEAKLEAWVKGVG